MSTLLGRRPIICQWRKKYVAETALLNEIKDLKGVPRLPAAKLSLADPEISGAKPIRKKGQLRRQLIIDTARDLLMKEGLASFVLRNVADQLAITHGNLQYYFSTKEDLLLAIFDEELRKYTAAFHNASVLASTPQGRLSAIIDASIKQLKDPSAKLWRMQFSMADQSEKLAGILGRENQVYDEALANELGEIAPHLSPQRRRHIAQMIRMLFDGYSIQLVWETKETPEQGALESEIKAAISAWIWPTDGFAA
jgi:AcrR family transcriptional regulator